MQKRENGFRLRGPGAAVLVLLAACLDDGSEERGFALRTEVSSARTVAGNPRGVCLVARRRRNEIRGFRKPLAGVVSRTVQVAYERACDKEALDFLYLYVADRRRTPSRRRLRR
jgi:hypothetical protein